MAAHGVPSQPPGFENVRLARKPCLLIDDRKVTVSPDHARLPGREHFSVLEMCHYLNDSFCVTVATGGLGVHLKNGFLLFRSRTTNLGVVRC